MININKRRRIIRYIKSCNIKIYEACLALYDNDSKLAITRYKKIMQKLQSEYKPEKTNLKEL